MAFRMRGNIDLKLIDSLEAYRNGELRGMNYWQYGKTRHQNFNTSIIIFAIW